MKGKELFDYSSGTIVQITDFGGIDMKGVGASDLLHLVLFKDGANTSTLFTGADTNERLSLELDVHYRKRGSLLNGISPNGVYLGTYHEFQHLNDNLIEKYGINTKQ